MNTSNNNGTFALTTNPILILGVGMNVFTYQVTGTGTATIQGSNNGVTWFNIADPITAPGSLAVMHSWVYLKKTGTADVLASRA